MNEYTVKRLALILAIQAELDAMRAANYEREVMGDHHTYSEEDFTAKAEELRELAHKHDHQL